jgi:hypothetical protein
MVSILLKRSTSSSLYDEEEEMTALLQSITTGVVCRVDGRIATHRLVVHGTDQDVSLVVQNMFVTLDCFVRQKGHGNFAMVPPEKNLSLTSEVR